MNLLDSLPMAGQVALVGGALLGLSIAIYALLSRIVPRAVAAALAPLLGMLAGCVFAGVGLIKLPPDGGGLHLMMLLPPFVLGLILPIIAGLLLWVLATRRRA
jgi:hypothetical protein